MSHIPAFLAVTSSRSLRLQVVPCKSKANSCCLRGQESQCVGLEFPKLGFPFTREFLKRWSFKRERPFPTYFTEEGVGARAGCQAGCQSVL